MSLRSFVSFAREVPGSLESVRDEFPCEISDDETRRLSTKTKILIVLPIRLFTLY